MRRSQSFFLILILMAVGSGVARAQAPAQGQTLTLPEAVALALKNHPTLQAADACLRGRNSTRVVPTPRSPAN